MAKFYVVWQGRKTGIFTDWATCKAQVDKFQGARYKSFPTRIEAEQAFGKPTSAAQKTKLTASNSKLINKSKKAKSSPLTNDQIDSMPYDIKIFTDGACEPNPGEAGSGIAIYKSNQLTELWFGIYQADGTNNTAELNALYESLKISQTYLNNGKTVAIYSDSSYSIQCLTTWAKGWAKNGWVRKGGEIKNVDLIKEMYALYLALENKIEIHHVNGHIGVEGNELADRMSILAIEKKQIELCLYTEVLDIDEILKKRRG